MMSCPPDVFLCVKAFTSSPSVRWNSTDANPILLTNQKPFVLLLYLLDQAENGNVRRSNLHRDIGDKDQSINDSILRLREKLGKEFFPPNKDSEIRLNLDLFSYWIDTREIDSIYPYAKSIINILQQKEYYVNTEDEERVYSAIGLYGAPFLTGFKPKQGSGIGPWVEKRRNELRMKVCTVLLALLNLLIRKERYAEALEHLKRLDAIDPDLLDKQCGHYWLWLATRFPDQDWHKRGFELLHREAWDNKVIIPSEAVWADALERVKSDHWEPTLQFLWSGKVEIERGGWQLRQEITDLVNAIKIAARSKTSKDTVFNITGASRGLGKSYTMEKVRDRLKVAGLKVAYINPIDAMATETILLSVIEQLDMTNQVSGLNTSQLQHQLKQELEMEAGARRCVIILDGLSARSMTAVALCDLFKGAVLVLVFDDPSLKLLLEDAQEKDFYAQYHEISSVEAGKIEDFLREMGLDIPKRDPNSNLWKSVFEATGGLPLALEVLAGIVEVHHPHLPHKFWGVFPREMKRLNRDEAPHHVRFLRWVFSEKRELPIWRGSLKVLHAAALFAPETPIPEESLTQVLASIANKMDIETLKQYRLLKPSSDGGYRLHRLVRDFILSQSPLPHYHAVLKAAYIDHIQAQLEESLGNDGAENDMARIDALRGDMLQILDSLLENGLSVRAIRLLVRLYDYFDRRGMYGHANNLYSRALEQPDVADDGLRFDLLAARGRIRLKQTNGKEGVEDFEEARSLLLSVKEPFKRIELYRDLGRAMMVRGAYKAAIDYCRHGLKEYNRITSADNPVLQVRTWLASLHIYLNLGIIYQEQGVYDTAYEMVTKVLEDKRLGNSDTYDGLTVTQFATMLKGLIEMESPEGKLSTARLHMENALTLAREMGNPERIARTQLNLGVISYWQKRPKQAQEYFTDGLHTIAAVGHEELRAWLTFNRGMAYLVHQRTDLSAASKMLSDAEEIVNHGDFHHILPHLDIGLGIFYLTIKEVRRGEDRFLRVLRQVGLVKNRHESLAKAFSTEVNPRIIIRALYGWVLASAPNLRPNNNLVLPQTLQRALAAYRQFRGVELTAEFEHAQTYFERFLGDKPSYNNLPDMLDKLAHRNIDSPQI